ICASSVDFVDVFQVFLDCSIEQGVRFQLLQAPPYIINFSGDLKYGMS
ncbi:putative 3-deoxy-D-manno-octulosonic acid transferase, partial [Trifolium medium]|nr:putative 3-deoxy-D-manno-octulosonic acid transferase [Trifolium medium]